jgi:spore coat protein U-like protein
LVYDYQINRKGDDITMKRQRTIILAVVAALVLMAGNAWALTATNNVPVSATVVATCAFTTVGDISFGTIASVGQAAVVTQPAITCTSGTNYTITDDDGLWESGANLNNLEEDGAGATLIPYTITYSAGPIAGTGAAQNMDVTANITGDQRFTTVGTYSDTIQFTVTY